jgi:WYL_2, Sm-like SH3 beta-barrel fold
MINFTDPNNLKNIDDVTEANLHAWLKSVLQTGPATITFTKVDGTERVMKCTLEAKDLPPIVPLAEGKTPRKETTSTKALRVFDLEKKEWRSFTVKNLKQISLG